MRRTSFQKGPTDPNLSQSKKLILQNFVQLALALIYYLLLFEKKK